VRNKKNKGLANTSSAANRITYLKANEFLYLNCAPHVLAFFSLLLFFVKGENRENKREAVTKIKPFSKRRSLH